MALVSFLLVSSEPHSFSCGIGMNIEFSDSNDGAILGTFVFLKRLMSVLFSSCAVLNRI